MKKINYKLFERVIFGSAIFFSALLYLSAIFISEDRVPFYVVKTNKYFLYSGETIRIYDRLFTKDSCKKVLDEDKDKEVEDIFERDKEKFNIVIACSIFEIDEGDFFEKKIKTQKSLLAAIIFVLMLMVFYFLRWSKKYKIGGDIYYRIHSGK